ncbi:uncharacterized protein LOC115773975 isoform X2 [Archocentrus centrarchus]|uniref:uncharacterized protein LOC115773975 isoform X2 n=1 Tax=Archocentrus centrarchus TaxID=63155 RepID=UPI0011E9F68A|nr:uncharacterized protein LOC115773975 isoform X2 [Archocentrus centrarchus]
MSLDYRDSDSEVCDSRRQRRRERIMMAEFRLFKICLFFMLPFTAVTQQHTELRAEVGGEVTLLCENGKNDHDGCSTTTWLFGPSTTNTAVALFEHGQIHQHAGFKSHRLRITDCSLVIKDVAQLHEGRYNCRHFRSGQLDTDTQIDLIVTNREISTADGAKSTRAPSATTGTAALSVTAKSSTTSMTSPTEKENNTNTVQTNTILIILAAGFAVLFIIMAVVGWRRTKRGKTQRSEEIAHNEHRKSDAQTSVSCIRTSRDDVIYANIKRT